MNNFENYFNMMNPMNNWAKNAEGAKMWDFWTESFNELKKMTNPTAASFNQGFLELQQKMMKSYTEMMDSSIKSSADGGEPLSFFKEYANLMSQNLEKMQKMALETSKTYQDDIVKKWKNLEKQVLESMTEYKDICTAHKTDASINLHVDYIKNSIHNSITNMQEMLKMMSEASLRATDSAKDVAKDAYKEMQESFCEVKKEKNNK